MLVVQVVQLITSSTSSDGRTSSTYCAGGTGSICNTKNEANNV